MIDGLAARAGQVGGVRPTAFLARKRPRWRVLTFAVTFLLLWFGFLELRGLYFPDEGRYAVIPWEMLATGDWVTPRINGFPYFEKPPLQYWITAIVFAVFGEDEWTARLWPTGAGLIAVFAVWWTARRLQSRRAGWLAAAVLASSCGYFLATQFVTLDTSLTGFLTCALCAFLLAQDVRASSADNRRWMLVAWALCALAVLTKGLVGVLLPILAVATYVIFARDLALLRRLHLLAGVAVFLAIALPWFVLVELRNPGFSEFFFVHEHWQRFTQPVHRRTGPWWYFVPIAVVFLLPWLPAIGAALARRRPAAGVSLARTFDHALFAWCWAGAILVFFSLSSSKLPAYIMPAMGAVALAVAAPLARRWDATIRITARTLVLGGLFIAAAAFPAGRWIKVPLVQDLYAANAGWVVAGGAILILTGALALRGLHRRRRIGALATLVLGGVLGCQVATVVAHRVDSYFSAEDLVERVTGDIRPFQPELPFYSVDIFDHTVPFYLGRTVTLVRERGELAWGIAAAPANFIDDLAEFARRWRDGGDAYAIMSLRTFETLQATGLPMRVVDGDGRRIIVARR